MAAIVVDFVRGLPKQVEQLRLLLEKNELDPLRRLAHQLRGACGGYGFDAITDVAAAAEDSIKTGDSPLVISARVNSLIQIIQRVEGYSRSEMRPAA
jgi:HPt (histidine-containing phosphotransfer) domain-containing protein